MAYRPTHPVDGVSAFLDGWGEPVGEALQRNEIAYLYSFTATFLIATE